MFRRSSLKWPIILATLLLVITVSLLVLYILAQAANRQWGLLAVGTIFFALLLAGVVVYLVLTIKEINLNRRQANFIDSVTHELKSPIASIKLILQTLEFREVPPDQQREFHKYMLEDVQRLDSLIDHLLAAARLDQLDDLPDMEDVLLAPLLEQCAADIRRRYDLPPEGIEIDVLDCVVRGRPPELEVVFSNLLDNGVKYGGSPPKVRIDARRRSSGRVLVRISDNGKGFASNSAARCSSVFSEGAPSWSGPPRNRFGAVSRQDIAAKNGGNHCRARPRPLARRHLRGRSPRLGQPAVEHSRHAPAAVDTPSTPTPPESESGSRD